MLYCVNPKGGGNIAKRSNLKSARIAAGLTQASVAKHLGIHTNSYQAFELGKCGTSELNWLKLYRLFDCKVPLHELMEPPRLRIKPGEGKMESANHC